MVASSGFDGTDEPDPEATSVAAKASGAAVRNIDLMPG
jgi:hypothetical protein